ncbi:DUF6233 domain-containing protein [Streptomyces albidus (ex Kaewkla and Franco 2022)]|uniref:DUF6233 domain-containing protein n=1 Tax=Streptomyces albidus (ex Kaewkla and Franco 2022) TaxID=722709 RepID=UPI0015EF80EF|nr:DUF6233 domain-containing protein [Streptomyces albidus (ex Kaewkla and Franco 2022)]
MAELPEDLPRLWTLRKYLLLQLAAVDRAIKQAENGITEQLPTLPRFAVAWRFTPAGTPRLGILHTADCWMAKGARLTIREVRELRKHPGRRIEPCDTCDPGKEQRPTP